MERNEIIKKMIEEAKHIIITLQDIGYSKVFRARFPYFSLYVYKEGGGIYRIVDESSPYWDKKKEAYAMNLYGSDRFFELIYSICRNHEKASEAYKKVIKL